MAKPVVAVSGAREGEYVRYQYLSIDRERVQKVLDHWCNTPKPGFRWVVAHIERHGELVDILLEAVDA